jgi:hypothetical protein
MINHIARHGRHEALALLPKMREGEPGPELA